MRLKIQFFGAFVVAASQLPAAEVAPVGVTDVEPAATAAAGDWEARRLATLRMVWTTVHDSYFDPTFGGVDWMAVGKRYREQLGAISNNAQLRELLQLMIGELRRTHFAILPREMSVFSPGERSRIGTTGVDLDWIEERIVVVSVRPGSAAERAGIRAGMEIESLDGTELKSITDAMRELNVDDSRAGYYLRNLVSARLRSAVGTRFQVAGKDADGKARALTVIAEKHEGDWSEPLGNYPAIPVECESRREDSGIGYLRFNSFAPAIMKQIRTFLLSLQPTDGLIIDLRGNPGGLGTMASGITGWLVDRELSLGSMQLRRGAMNFSVYPQEGAFLGPVAVLIDGRSASTSEILAAGLRDHGRARLFGRRTAGAALPSVFRTLPTGDLFQYPIADVKTPKGTSIEGNGVEPDEIVGSTLADVAGHRDAVLEAARAWLDRKVGVAASTKSAERR